MYGIQFGALKKLKSNNKIVLIKILNLSHSK
jgi:hypothetical protein